MSTFAHSLRGWFLRFARNRLAPLGALIVVGMLLLALLAPFLALHDPNQMSIAERLAPLSVDHPFGTDQFGRDIYSRVIYGRRVSLAVGILPVAQAWRSWVQGLETNIRGDIAFHGGGMAYAWIEE